MDDAVPKYKIEIDASFIVKVTDMARAAAEYPIALARIERLEQRLKDANDYSQAQGLIVHAAFKIPESERSKEMKAAISAYHSVTDLY